MTCPCGEKSNRLKGVVLALSLGLALFEKSLLLELSDCRLARVQGTVRDMALELEGGDGVIEDAVHQDVVRDWASACGGDCADSLGRVDLSKNGHG